MFKLNPKSYYLRHDYEIQRFVYEKTNWIHLINQDNAFKNYTEYKKNIFSLDLNSNLDDQVENIRNQKYDLIVITDIFEVTDDIYNLLGTLNEMLTNDGKILINSINTKWNLFLLAFETLKFKKISRARSYIHLKKYTLYLSHLVMKL